MFNRNSAFENDSVANMIQGNNNGVGSLAPLDSAFNYSQSMSNFQNDLIAKNPLLAHSVVSDSNVNSGINKKINSLIKECGECERPQSGSNPDLHNLLSQQSEEKINNGVDEIIKSINNPNLEHSVTKASAPQRGQRFQSDSYGSELLEKFNGVQTIPATPVMLNTTTYTQGMGMFRTILLLVLIAILIYAIYWLYKNNKSKNTMNDFPFFGTKTY